MSFGKHFFGAFALLLVGFAGQAHAFPGMIRHGYAHCTSCHVSPAGGGLLTTYGRELAQEVLSRASAEGEGRFLGNWTSAPSRLIPDWVLLGGDIRAIGVLKDNPIFREQRFSLMQADFEAAVRLQRFTIDASVGYYDGYARSLRHYVHFQASDEWGLRAGRFMVNYGINTSEHTVTTRRNLGFDQSNETYNLEGSWLGERGSLFATLLMGRPESVENEDGISIGQTGVAETGASIRASYFLTDSIEGGLSLLRASNASRSRDVVGPFFVLGFTPHFFAWSEWDLQWSKPEGASSARLGGFCSNRLDYEWSRGWHGYLLQELARPDFSSLDGLVSRVGAGISAYPRPHYEIDLRAYRQYASPDVTRLGTFGWLLLHYYL